MEEIYWECFFNNAGINGVTSKEYANLFVKNKISDTILSHLNDNYLKSMGIDAIGDIIRILKYSKDFIEEKKVSPKTLKETTERRVEILPNKTTPNEEKSKKMTISSTYSKPPGCELPVAVKRIVTPEIEGRYKIKYPSKSPITNEKYQSQKSTESKQITKEVLKSNRTVILNDTSHFTVDKKVSVLKRLGQSGEKYEKDADNETDLKKKRKTDVDDSGSLSKRFASASIPRDNRGSNSKTSEKNSKTNDKSVFARLGDSLKGDRGIESCATIVRIGGFKAPTVDTKVKIRSGHTTDSSQKMEATSTTEFTSLRSDSLNTKKHGRHVLNRLGRKV